MNRGRLVSRCAAVVAAVLVAVFVAFGVYVSAYYHADGSVKGFLSRRVGAESVEAGAGEGAVDAGSVRLEETGYGWFLDGPSDENAMVFYPGAKVDEAAYIPILYRFAEEGMDVCLVKMPFHLAVFGIDIADEVMAQYDYENWYIGGHSLGGAMGAGYAAGHADELRGVVLFAAYATKKLDDSLKEIVVYGSEDGVLRLSKLAEGRAFSPKRYFEHVIEGGNHAQFGNYGEQKGDGRGLISAQEQQEEAVRVVMEAVGVE